MNDITHIVTLPGFVPEIHAAKYREAFCREFESMDCRIEGDQLVRVWKRTGRPMSVNLSIAVTHWHQGWRCGAGIV